MSEQNNPTAGLTNLLEDFVNDYQVKPRPNARPKGSLKKPLPA